MCFPISRIAITIQTRSMNEAEGPALLILIQLSHFERVGLINFQFPKRIGCYCRYAAVR